MFQCSALRSVLLFSCLGTLFSTASQAAVTPWLSYGPDGGDARSFAPDPKDHTHLYAGTANGWIYESHDNGAKWRRLARVGMRDDLVLDNIVVDPSDPRHLVVGAWVITGEDGGLYVSRDGGVTWASQNDMRGQSIRALTFAPSDPKIVIAGTLKGVYRSADGGNSWSPISPPDSTEIHEVESIAIDPKDPTIIYAGTWHLPWKTTDGGAHWANIKQGIIDDSDVFSIIIDPTSPNVVYASACSGIYKSENAGALFHKVQGIPSTARRTRVLQQDPVNLNVVFAGTTEGLYRTKDSGKFWERTTGPRVIVNDVAVDPTNPRHVLLATDRGGILASDDGGDTFHSSNTGFSSRQIATMKRDSQHPGSVYVGVVNDKEWGGVFQSDNGGIDWTQHSEGLEGRDVFSLGQSPDGTLIAGTAHGLFRLDRTSSLWSRVEQPIATAVVSAKAEAPPSVRAAVPVGRNQFAKRTGLKTSSTHPATSTSPATTSHGPSQTTASDASAPHAETATHAPLAKKGDAPAESARSPFDGSVFALVTSDQTVLAATSAGLLTSMDQGVSWRVTGPAEAADWRYLAAAKSNVIGASLHAIQLSKDSGATWSPVKMPEAITLITAATVEPSGDVWVGGREGVVVSSDFGNTWTTPKNLFLSSVTSIFYDEMTNRVLVTSIGQGSAAFTVQLPQKTITYADSGWKLRLIRPVGDHLVGATFFDGVVIDQKAVSSPAGEPAPAIH